MGPSLKRRKRKPSAPQKTPEFKDAYTAQSGAFDIWLSKPADISDHTLSMLNLLYKQSSEMVEGFYNFEWDKASTEVGYLPK